MTLSGPQGMHNVSDARWTDHRHESFYEQNPAKCRESHGADLLGTALSRAAADRGGPFVLRTARARAVPAGRSRQGVLG
jgi:hypothetical protein